MKRKLFAVLAVMILCVAMSPLASAEFNFDLVPDGQAGDKAILYPLSFTPLTEEPERGSIESYAVSDSGRVAILTRPNLLYFISEQRPDTILVYSADGEFEFGLSTAWNGPTFVDWDGERLLFISRKGNVFYVVNQDGYVSEFHQLAYTDANDKRYEKLKGYVQEKDGCTYRATKDLGLLNLVYGHATKLVRKDASGNETVLYEAGPGAVSTFLASAGILLGIAVILLAVGIVVFMKRLKAKQLPLPPTCWTAPPGTDDKGGFPC